MFLFVNTVHFIIFSGEVNVLTQTVINAIKINATVQ